MEKSQGYAPAVELTRGEIVECVHFGALAMVDSSGQLLYSIGDPKLVTFPRSSMKPFQALPFIEIGGHQAFGLTEEEVAIFCASHHGTDEHVRVLKSIHQKVGLTEDLLQCGVHWPSDKDTTEAMKARGETPTPYRHNCSGKHTGMLAHAVFRALGFSNYLDTKHGVQKLIRKAVAEMCAVPNESLILGIDGCSAPVYAMPLDSFAYAVARLCDPVGLSDARQDGCRTITKAMMSYPIMVAGPKGMDTVLMQTLPGKVVVKGGAEGYQMIGVMPDVLYPGSKGIGIAFKFSDGDPTRRATYRLTVELLTALGFEEAMSSEMFADFNVPILRNWRGLEIGEIKVCEPIKVDL